MDTVEARNLPEAILSNVVEPRSVPSIVEILRPEGHSERDVRSKIWHMVDDRDVVFGKDWKVQAGNDHLRQLYFPFLTDLPSAFEAKPRVNTVTVFEAKASSSEQNSQQIQTPHHSQTE